jgi:hypothetical protein
MRHLILAILCCMFAVAACADEQRLLIAPHATDASLSERDSPHLIVYEPSLLQPLLVWLPGTNGHPDAGPKKFFATVREQGYRFVGLSYLTAPAVGQVCTPRRVAERRDCAELFRQQRVWGDVQSGLIDDRPADAIVPRLVKLLQYLASTDAAGRWGEYLDSHQQPRWDRIVLAGQSQGGGMAEFLAQTRSVAGVISFSGGWDHGANGDVARWYRRASATPPERWQATYHVQEEAADSLARICKLLGLPPDHVHALNLPVSGRMAHTEGVGNIAYLPLWREMLGKPPAYEEGTRP